MKSWRIFLFFLMVSIVLIIIEASVFDGAEIRLDPKDPVKSSFFSRISSRLSDLFGFSSDKTTDKFSDDVPKKILDRNPVLCVLFPFLCFDSSKIFVPKDSVPKLIIDCSSRKDCLDNGFEDPAPYCESNEKVFPKVWCFNSGTHASWCGIHNWGLNRKSCASSYFCRELDFDNDGEVDNLLCSEGVYIETFDPPPIPAGPPGIPAPFPSDGVPGDDIPVGGFGDEDDEKDLDLDFPPLIDLKPFSCKKRDECSLPVGEFAVSCDERDGDGRVNDLVRKSPCCQGGLCSVCESVTNCKYGCSWREELNPPRVFCCESNAPCDEPICNENGVCDPGEIPDVCSDCPICNNDGVCDGKRGENFNNCVSDCSVVTCCSNAECGSKLDPPEGARKYKCEDRNGDGIKETMVHITNQCNNVCTDISYCQVRELTADCSLLGKVCRIDPVSGRSGCRY